MIIGHVRGQELKLDRTTIAADSIKYLEAEFHFAGRDWDGYVKTAYFVNGTSKFALVLADDRITADMGLNLTAGEWEVKLSGVKGGSRITTTTEHVYVREFGSTDGTLPDVTATQAEQILAKIGDLSSLTTEDKTNLVAAINEAAKSGGGSGGGKDGTGIESITYKGKDEDGGNVYTVLLTDGTSYDITAPKGVKGDKGDTGAAGPQGPAGAPGKDGASMGITGATVGQIAKISAVDTDGKPTAWEPVDMPTGGGETWEKLVNATLEEAVEMVTYSFKRCKRIKALITPVLTANVGGWKRITINNVSYPTLSSKVLTIEGICIEVDSEYPPYVKIGSGVIKSSSGNGINTGYTAKSLENIARNGITQFGCQTAAILTAGTKIEIWGVKS